MAYTKRTKSAAKTPKKVGKSQAQKEFEEKAKRLIHSTFVTGSMMEAAGFSMDRVGNLEYLVEEQGDFGVDDFTIDAEGIHDDEDREETLTILELLYGAYKAGREKGKEDKEQEIQATITGVRRLLGL